MQGSFFQNKKVRIVDPIKIMGESEQIFPLDSNRKISLAHSSNSTANLYLALPVPNFKPIKR
jgi:hypothetical protein